MCAVNHETDRETVEIQRAFTSSHCCLFSHMLPLSLKKMTLAAGCDEKGEKKTADLYISSAKSTDIRLVLNWSRC